MAVYLLFIVLSFITEMPILKIRYVIPFILIIFRSIASLSFKLKSKYVKLFAVWFLLGAFPTMMYNHNLDIQTLIVQIGYMIIAYYLLKIPESCDLVEAIIYIFHFYNLYLLLFNRIQLANNYVSVIYIILLTIVYLQKNEQHKEPPIVHSFISLFFSVLAEARGGIISLLILNVIIVFKMKSKNKKRLLIILVSIIPLISVYLFVIQKKPLINSSMFSHFEENGLQSNGRFDIWSLYLSNCSTSLKNIIFGTNFQQFLDSNFKYYRPPHVHSSFLAYYGSYGLLLSIITFSILIIGFIRYIKYKDIYTAAIMLCFMFRSFTDIVFGGYYGDIAFYAFIYCIIDYNSSDKVRFNLINKIGLRKANISLHY